MTRLAFDIGGTFTDFVLEDEDGALHSLKVPTTPNDPAVAVIAGLSTLEKQTGIAAASLDTVLHATTIATNAVIERKGCRTALITTAGFRDVLIIGRQKRYETYDLYMDKPAPLVRRRDIFEVAERIAYDGTVVEPLDEATARSVVARVAEGGYEAVAVTLLHSYANPAHELRLREMIAAEMPGVAVSVSAEVSPKHREYERTNTTVANSYVKPLVARYLDRLGHALSERGFHNEIFIMQSSGGLVSPAFAGDHPIRIVESGPAAGVLMARDVGLEEGFAHVIAFDMGGTTAKLGAVDDGKPAITPTFEIDPVRYKRGSGLPLNTPAVELLEIGAGGGSIARTELGTIAVGPESAGADPGPLCYGAGGERATVTDANLVLGYLDPDYFNDGAFALDVSAARAGIDAQVAGPLGISIEEAAWGIHLVATGNMEHAIRIVSVERGRDPRKYVTVAFGGAGPLHAARLARRIGVPRVIVPRGAGVGSAIGLLRADAQIDAAITRLLRLDETDASKIREIYDALEARVRSDLGRLGVPGVPVWSRFAYMRFAGQGFEIHVPLPTGGIADDYPERAIDAFHEAYARRHRFSDETTAVEAVDWYLVATLPTARKATEADTFHDAVEADAKRRAYFGDDGGWRDTRILQRDALETGKRVAGPAIVQDADSTTVVPPGDTVELTERGHLLLRIAQVSGR